MNRIVLSFCLLAFAACDSNDGDVTPDVAGDAADTQQGDVEGDEGAEDTATPDTAAPDASTPDTTTPDTSAPDTSAPDVTEDTTTPDVVTPPAGKLCPQVAPCYLTQCAGEEGEALTTCLETAAETCGTAADEDETALVTAWVGCMNTAGCEASESKKHYNCMRSSCLDATVACYAGGPGAGSDGCGKLSGCIALCVDFLGDVDHACVRGCHQASKEDAPTLYYDWRLCVGAECWDSANPELCSQQVSATDICLGSYTNCQGDL